MDINTDVYIFGIKYTFDSFWDFFIAVREWMLALPLIYQILIIVGLVALTVGSFSLVFYIVKAVFQLVFEILSILVKFIRSLFVPRKHHRHYDYRYDRPRKMSRPARRYTRPPVAPVAPVTPVAPVVHVAPVALVAPVAPVAPRSQPTRVMVQTSVKNKVIKFPQLLHCPNCGGTFTNEMMRILSESESVYCEFCGNKLEYELQ